jgi:hypothetical protein
MWALLVAVAALAADPPVLPLDAVVLVEQGGATCAGAFVDDRGTVATAYHCVAHGGRPRVTTRDGRRAIGRVRRVDPSMDLAVIDVPDLAGEAWLALRVDPPELGEVVRPVGHPYARANPSGSSRARCGGRCPRGWSRRWGRARSRRRRRSTPATPGAPCSTRRDASSRWSAGATPATGSGSRGWRPACAPCSTAGGAASDRWAARSGPRCSWRPGRAGSAAWRSGGGSRPPSGIASCSEPPSRSPCRRGGPWRGSTRRCAGRRSRAAWPCGSGSFAASGRRISRATGGSRACSPSSPTTASCTATRPPRADGRRRPRGGRRGARRGRPVGRARRAVADPPRPAVAGTFWMF